MADRLPPQGSVTHKGLDSLAQAVAAGRSGLKEVWVVDARDDQEEEGPGDGSDEEDGAGSGGSEGSSEAWEAGEEADLVEAGLLPGPGQAEAGGQGAAGGAGADPMAVSEEGSEEGEEEEEGAPMSDSELHGSDSDSSEGGGSSSSSEWEEVQPGEDAEIDAAVQETVRAIGMAGLGFQGV